MFTTQLANKLIYRQFRRARALTRLINIRIKRYELRAMEAGIGVGQ